MKAGSDRETVLVGVIWGKGWALVF